MKRTVILVALTMYSSLIAPHANATILAARRAMMRCLALAPVPVAGYCFYNQHRENRIALDNLQQELEGQKKTIQALTDRLAGADNPEIMTWHAYWEARKEEAELVDTAGKINRFLSNTWQVSYEDIKSLVEAFVKQKQVLSSRSEWKSCPCIDEIKFLVKKDSTTTSDLMLALLSPLTGDSIAKDTKHYAAIKKLLAEKRYSPQAIELYKRYALTAKGGGDVVLLLDGHLWRLAKEGKKNSTAEEGP